MQRPPRTVFADLAQIARGLLMGAADIVPGVSGGTVALLLGIYPRLLTAISHFDAELLRLVRSGQWAAALRHIDLRFLISLAVGIVVGVFTLAGLMHFLLEQHRELTYAAFFGLILASGILVARMTRPANEREAFQSLGLGVLAAVLAAWLVLRGQLDGRPGHLYEFTSGAIAICAMILPGISGAYILVLLGKYDDIIDILHRLKEGHASSADMISLAVFAAGCAIGLLLFSKVLKALLGRFHSETMAVLGGFMIGSLVKVWPFQRPRVPGAEIDKTTPTMPVWPEEWNHHVATCLAVAVAAFVVVILIDTVAQRWRSSKSMGKNQEKSF